MTMVRGRREVTAFAGRNEIAEPGQSTQAEIVNHVDERSPRGQGIAIEAGAETTQPGQEISLDAGRGEITGNARREDQVGREPVDDRLVSGALGADLLERGADLAGRRGDAGSAVAPGDGDRSVGVRQPVIDARRNVAVRVHVKVLAPSFPPDELGTQRTRLGGRDGWPRDQRSRSESAWWRAVRFWPCRGFGWPRVGLPAAAGTVHFSRCGCRGSRH